jgi:two-component system cell cycle sensor histidine kinase/response regulator CckA
MRLLAVRILERAGYRVFAVADGEEASAIFVEHCAEIALLVLDVVMPRMGGVEVRERAHRLRADVPVILCSGYAGPGLTHSDGANPTQRRLQKPYGADELLTRVRQALDAKTTGRS